MKPYRLERLEKELLRIINNALFSKGRDERLKQITVTEVKLSPDQQFAKVYFSVLDEEIDVEYWTIILTKASGFIKREIANAKVLRRIPEIRFIYDDTGERVRELDDALDKIKE